MQEAEAPSRVSIEGGVVTKRHPSELLLSLEWERSLLEELSRRKLPFDLPALMVRHDPISSGALVVTYPYIQGEGLDYDDPRDVRLLAAVTAHLHIALDQAPFPDRPGQALFKNPIGFARAACDPFAVTLSTLRVGSSRDSEELLEYWNEEAARIARFLEGRYKALPAAICHNDLTSGNVLKREGKVAAVIDFEYACRVPRALDTAMGLRMVMQPWRKRSPWTPLRLYASAYRSVRSAGLTREEIGCLPDLLALRTASSIFLRLSRVELIRDHEETIVAIARLRAMRRWLEEEEDALRDVAEEAFVGREDRGSF